MIIKVDGLLCVAFIPFCFEDTLEVGNGSDFKVHIFSSSSEVRAHNPLNACVMSIF